MGRRLKIVDLVVHTYGNYLGIEKGCIILRDKNKKEEKYPLFEAEIGEVVLTSGNLVSTGALSALGFDLLKFICNYSPKYRQSSFTEP